jgi:serine/threonine-protein kinase
VPDVHRPARRAGVAAISATLFLSERTVETHVSSIFGNLGLRLSPSDHRRVLAVLTYLRA